jgi:hypothetical protein
MARSRAYEDVVSTLGDLLPEAPAGGEDPAPASPQETSEARGEGVSPDTGTPGAAPAGPDGSSEPPPA